MRYFGAHNFLGRPVKGYRAGECILTKRAALALKKVQQRLKPRGLSLKVYDCYRPQRAVNDFVAWSKAENDKRTKAEFYPTLKKKRLFSLGYIAKRSSHSRGSTVDLTIVPLPPERQPDYEPDKQIACFEAYEKRYRDNSLDFGTGYDCFHELSHTRNPAVGEIARRNRALLLKEMALAGFENYFKEWWHFTLKDEPYKRQRFDFPIVAKEPDNADGADLPELTPEAQQEAEDMSLAPAKAETPTFNEGDKGATDVPLTEGGDQIEPLYSARVICVARDDVLNVRDLAGAKGKIIGALPRMALDVRVLGCNGTDDLARWHLKDRAARRAAGVPWCEISGYRAAEGSDFKPLSGWVSGAYLVPEGAAARACLSN
jgi:D-alanyl-D-alanine dipeptidase